MLRANTLGKSGRPLIGLGVGQHEAQTFSIATPQLLSGAATPRNQPTGSLIEITAGDGCQQQATDIDIGLLASLGSAFSRGASKVFQRHRGASMELVGPQTAIEPTPCAQSPIPVQDTPFLDSSSPLGSEVVDAAPVDQRLQDQAVALEIKRRDERIMQLQQRVAQAHENELVAQTKLREREWIHQQSGRTNPSSSSSSRGM